MEVVSNHPEWLTFSFEFSVPKDRNAVEAMRELQDKLVNETAKCRRLASYYPENYTIGETIARI